MTLKLFQFTFLLVLCYFFSTIKCSEDKNKKVAPQNGPRFYQLEPLEWWRALVYSGQNRNLRNLDSLNKLKNRKIISEINKKARYDKSDMQSLFNDQLADLDDPEQVGVNDFDMFNFEPSGLSKRDQDYGHLRFGRSADIRTQMLKKTLDKKVEPDYGHFRFG